jgi:hypothetical protein
VVKGHQSLAPVTQIGKAVTWTGPQQGGGGKSEQYWLQYTFWSDGDNHLRGVIGSRKLTVAGIGYNANLAGYYIDLTCASEVLPSVTWADWFTEQNTRIVMAPVDISSVDPP